MQVPSTPTASDKFEEVRKINIDIAKLTSAKESANKVFADARAAADDALKRTKEMEEKIKEMESWMSEMGENVREFIVTCRKVLQDMTETMESVASQAKQVAYKIGQMIEEINKLEKNKKNILDSIAKENELITQQRSDLGVYHRRIVAAAAVYLPGQNIVL